MSRRGVGWSALLVALLFATGAVVLLVDLRTSDAPASVGAEAVERAYREQRSDLWVVVEGRVTRLLSDDLQGSRHQRFVIAIEGGHTLLVSHNIDLAPRVPIEVGSRVSVRGEYVWNDRGGLLHWTHHDPRQRQTGGWIRHRGETYR